MISTNSYIYIQIGLAIRLLVNIKETYNKQFACEAIAYLKSNLEMTDFPVTKSAMNSKSYMEMESKIEEIENNSTPIGEDIRRLIKSEFETLEKVIFPESCIKLTYTFPQRRFNSDYLLNKPEKLLSEGVFIKLETIARQDIASACRCILIGEATAAAFHILRATESVLKSYYFHHRRQKRLEKPMWANMVDQLKSKSKNKPPETLLATLDIIRTAYRNPTQHPEAIYHIDSAQDLLGVCLDAIGKMGAELPAK